MTVIAPLRDRVWTRDEEIEYALERGIPIAQTAASPYSIDENLFGRSIECGILEDPWQEPPEEPYELTGDPRDVAAARGGCRLLRARRAGRARRRGDAARTRSWRTLNGLAGAYGIGRIDMIENRAVGIKSREVYEAPAAIALIEAHRALEDLVLTKSELRVKRQLEVAWTELVYEGQWFSPARRGDRRLRRHHAGHRRGRGAAFAPAGRGNASSAAVRSRRSTPRRWRRMRPARHSRTRRPKASSASRRWRRSSLPRGRRMTAETA